MRVLRRGLRLTTALPARRDACSKALGEQCADQGGRPGGAANRYQPTEESLADQLREEGARSSRDQRKREWGAICQKATNKRGKEHGEADEEWCGLKHVS